MCSSAPSRSAPSWPCSPSSARSPTRSSARHTDATTADARSPPLRPRSTPRPRASPTSTSRSPAAWSSSPPAAATARSPSTAQGGGKAASGSGFVIDTAGHIVTNDHVVEDADRFTVRFGEKGDPIPAKLVGKDPSSDLAVLSIDPKAVKGGVKPLQLASSKSLRPGEAAIAIGSPFGLSGTVTTGIISALGREIEAPNGFSIPGAVQTDAAINPGNSGGPLLDAAGPRDRRQLADRLLAAAATPASASPSRSTASATSCRSWSRTARSTARTSASPPASAPRRPARWSARSTPARPAAEAGIRTGDLIVGFDGKTIRNPSELSLAVLTKKPGDKVKVELKRDGEHPAP